MRETLTRLLSGIVYILLLAGAIFFSAESFLLLFGIFLAIAVFEFCNLVHLEKTIPVLLAITGYTLFAFFPATQLTLLLLLAATLFVSLKCIGFLFENRPNRSDVSSRYVYLIGYIILPFILLAKIPFPDNIYHPKIIFSLFILIWTNDTFAFIVGKSFGRHKLFERISPKKTIEGFVGGIAFAVLAGILLATYYLSEPVIVWIGNALIIGLAGTIGDLVESKFKRVAQVKDSGKIMPGHGGILDRLDSVIFAAPFVLLFYQIINYVS
jgi:phosphatidate cytidylyltransferase